MNNKITYFLITFSVLMGLSVGIANFLFKDELSELYVQFNNTHRFDTLLIVSKSNPDLIADIEHTDTISFHLNLSDDWHSESKYLSFDTSASDFVINGKVNYNLIEFFVVTSKVLYKDNHLLVPVYSQNVSEYNPESVFSYIELSDFNNRLSLMVANNDLEHNESYSISMAQFELFSNIYRENNINFLLELASNIEHNIYEDFQFTLNGNVKTIWSSYSYPSVDDIIDFYNSERSPYLNRVLGDTFVKFNPVQYKADLEQHLERVDNIETELHAFILDNAVPINHKGVCYLKMPKNVTFDSRTIGSIEFYFSEYDFKPYQCDTSIDTLVINHSESPISEDKLL